MAHEIKPMTRYMALVETTKGTVEMIVRAASFAHVDLVVRREKGRDFIKILLIRLLDD